MADGILQLLTVYLKFFDYVKWPPPKAGTKGIPDFSYKIYNHTTGSVKGLDTFTDEFHL